MRGFFVKNSKKGTKKRATSIELRALSKQCEYLG